MDKQLVFSFAQSLIRQGLVIAATSLNIKPDAVGLDQTSAFLTTVVVALGCLVWSLLTAKKNIETVPAATKAVTPSALGPLLLLALILGVGTASFTSISMAGCASAQFDARVTPQGLSLLAGDIEEDAGFGVQAAPPDEQEGLRQELNAFLEAVRSKDATLIAGQGAPRWGIIKALALNGIDFQVQTDQIGPGVADIHRESVFRFEGLLNRVR